MPARTTRRLARGRLARTFVASPDEAALAPPEVQSALGKAPAWRTGDDARGLAARWGAHPRRMLEGTERETRS